MFLVTRTKPLLPLLPIYPFLSNKRKGKSLREVVIFYLKKIKKVKWETPQKENVVPI